MVPAFCITVAKPSISIAPTLLPAAIALATSPDLSPANPYCASMLLNAVLAYSAEILPACPKVMAAFAEAAKASLLLIRSGFMPTKLLSKAMISLVATPVLLLIYLADLLISCISSSVASVMAWKLFISDFTASKAFTEATPKATAALAANV